tara:strand:- start:922 stop:1869 length:948 start_codon:yes stop_codon:yes gene_type:complete
MKEDIILKIYKKAYEIRSSEMIISENYQKGYIRCPIHLSVGQELVSSILYGFNDIKDLAVSTHRSHAHYLGKGGNLRKLFDELHGLPSGCSGGKGGSMHLIDTSVGFMGSTAIVANTIPIGVGMAEAQKLSSSQNITYIFLGDGATEEGVFYESLNYASVRKLPCIFIIENNNYSVYTSLKERQGNIPIENKVKAFNINYYSNYLHDFKSLYNSWSNAIARTKKGGGPSIIEVMTNRDLAHCGDKNDDDLRYRPTEYLKKWNQYDIIDIYRKYLLESGIKIEYIDKLNENITALSNRLYLESENDHLKLKSIRGL